eukprot:TRINITY_DN4584_c0_g2_i4.p1 TRINITY_DN4584_c0_g2~~TRINITY_DN4584_c0_g2_i4.p1  ORF type:complete len:181 (-),score=5.26 TRINITY_DN4584_c0_g2_i4:152-694(-)
MAHLPATVTDTDNKVHALRYVRILVTANPVKENCTPLPRDEQPSERIMELGRANDAFVKLSFNKFDELSRVAFRWVDDTRADYEAKLKTFESNPESSEQRPPLKEHLMASKRAECLIKYFRDTEGTMELDVECGPVLGECCMDLDKITQWCPTVGLFASNIIIIRDLAGGGKVDEAQADK